MKDIMKLYLDDIREAPKGWTRTYNIYDTVEWFWSHHITDISLDHDLGMDNENGYDVLLWIEEQVHVNSKFKCPNIFIHTANPSARRKMELAVNNINKYCRR